MEHQSHIDELDAMARQASRLNRYALSDDMHDALVLIGDFCERHFPGAHVRMHEYPTGTRFNHWEIGPKWELEEASLRHAGRDVALDLAQNPLGVMLYSKPVAASLGKMELAQYCHTRPDVAEAIPYVFRQQYRHWERRWGVCLPHAVWESLPDGLYDLKIVTRESAGVLETLEVTLPGKRPSGVLIVLHVCHQNQVNDGFSGALAALAGMVKAVRDNPDAQQTYTLLFTTEIIGPAAYLYHNQAALGAFEHAICLSWCGQQGRLSYTKSRQETRFDRMAAYVLGESCTEFAIHAYGDNGIGDEYIVDSPGIGIPCACLQRAHPKEWYHTSLDDLRNFSIERTVEVGDCLARILGVYERDWIPIRRFTGMPCLSSPELDLYLEPAVLNRISNLSYSGVCRSGLSDVNQYVFMNTFLHDVDGVNSVFDVSRKHNVPFDFLDGYLREFEAKGLVSRVRDRE